jgi:predicted dehydrogenase
MVRSDGLRNRRTHRIPRCGNHHHVPERPAQSTATFGPGAATGPLKKVDTEDAAIVIFKTQSGVLGSVIVSQVSAGRRNRLWFEFDGEHRSAVFNQENPETAWLGSQISAEILNRDPAHGSPAQRRLSKLPAGHPRDTPNASRTSLMTPTRPFEAKPVKDSRHSTTARDPHTSSTLSSTQPRPASGSR